LVNWTAYQISEGLEDGCFDGMSKGEVNKTRLGGGKQTKLGWELQKTYWRVYLRGKPKALGLANWMVALMECPRGKPKDLCLANQTAYYHRVSRMAASMKCLRGKPKALDLELQKADQRRTCPRPKGEAKGTWLGKLRHPLHTCQTRMMNGQLSIIILLKAFPCGLGNCEQHKL
jgi:hypothetical protein